MLYTIFFIKNTYPSLNQSSLSLSLHSIVYYCELGIKRCNAESESESTLIYFPKNALKCYQLHTIEWICSYFHLLLKRTKMEFQSTSYSDSYNNFMIIIFWLLLNQIDSLKCLCVFVFIHLFLQYVIIDEPSTCARTLKLLIYIFWIKYTTCRINGISQ